MRGAAFALLLACSVPAAAAEPPFTPGGTAQLRAVADGATLDLADGRVLRLAGIDMPARGALARQAKDVLEKLLAGGAINLRFAGNPRDRQGRVLAQVYAGTVWIQGELIRRGLARVRSTPDERLGVADMLALEHEARRHHRGVWADPAYAVIGADNAAKFAGSFQLVSGTIVDAAKTSSGIVLRFGAARSGSLALAIGAPAVKLWREAGLDPLALMGKRVLVRGFIDGSTRPAMAVTHPEQIEILRSKKAAPAKKPGPR